VVSSTTAPGHTSAARGRSQAGGPAGEASGLAGGDGIDRSTGSLRGRSAWGGRESEGKTNRLGRLVEELGAELLTPVAATGTARTGRGSPASAREAPWSRELWARWDSTREVSRGSGAVGGPAEPVRLNHSGLACGSS
jgi:hypothetical protein